MKRFSRAFGIGVVLLGAQFSQAASDFHSPQGHFSLVIADGWEQVPDETLSVFNARVARPKGVPEYNVAFQEKSDRPFVYPYMLLQIRTGDRKTDQQFQDAVAGAAASRDVESAQDALRSLVDDAAEFHVGEERYSTKNKMFLIRTDNTVAGVGRVVSVMAKSYSQDGSVVMHFYSTKDRFASDLPRFARMIDSFSFDEGHAY